MLKNIAQTTAYRVLAKRMYFVSIRMLTIFSVRKYSNTWHNPRKVASTAVHIVKLWRIQYEVVKYWYSSWESSWCRLFFVYSTLFYSFEYFRKGNNVCWNEQMLLIRYECWFSISCTSTIKVGRKLINRWKSLYLLIDSYQHEQTRYNYKVVAMTSREIFVINRAHTE